MSSMAEILDALAEQGPQGISRFEASLDPQWIQQALAATGKASVRRRKLPAEQVAWLVVGMALFADRSIRNVVEHLSLVAEGVESLDPSAIPQARYRLGPEPMEWLFHKVADAWRDSPGCDDYHGLSLYGVDGSHLRVQDSDANFGHYGKPGGRGGSGDSGYPQVRVACLMNLGNRLLTDASFGPFATSEHVLAASLWDSVPDNSLTLVDRGFVSYEIFTRIVDQGRGRHLLVRFRSDLKPFELEELPDGTILVELRPCNEARRKHPGLRPSIRGRLIHYQHPGGQPGRLFTTLVDHERYPADEVVALYHERWELEVGYDELKTHMLERKECLRSLKPEGVAQELWGLLLTYNLVRREMLLAAQQHELPPQRISFRSSLLWIRNFWLTAWLTSPGSLPKHLGELRSTLDVLILPVRRSDRRYPRHVKIKMSNYPRNRGKRGRSPPADG